MFLSLFLTALGVGLVASGFFLEVQKWDPFHGYLFWVSGVLVFLPGVFYLGKIVQAYRSKDDQERVSILREIPEL